MDCLALAILARATPGESATESFYENTRHDALLEISHRTNPVISALSYLSFSRHAHVGDRSGGI
jgi:hypothetical protein